MLRNTFLLALALSSISAQTSDPAYQPLERAYQALRDKGYDQAIASFREAVRINPSFPSPRNNLGLALLDQGAVDEAMASFREALQLKPDFPEAHYNLGRALQQQGKLDEAEACCRRALELRPEYIDAYNNLGVVLASARRFDQAAACLRQALALDPARADAYNNLGTVLKDQDRLEEAAACFRRALELGAHSRRGPRFRHFARRQVAVSAAAHRKRADRRHWHRPRRAWPLIDPGRAPSARCARRSGRGCDRTHLAGAGIG